MTHIGYGPPSIDEVVPLLRPGDILTHCFTGGDMRIVDDAGTAEPSGPRSTRHRIALLQDDPRSSLECTGHPPTTAEAMLRGRGLPDVISSDIHQMAIQGPMFDLPTTLSKFLNLGLSLPDVIERRPHARPRRWAGRTSVRPRPTRERGHVAIFRGKGRLRLPRRSHEPTPGPQAADQYAHHDRRRDAAAGGGWGLALWTGVVASLY